MKSNKEITKEEIEYYYNVTNHSQKECAEYFEMSVGMFIKTLKKYNIVKDKQKHVEMIKRIKEEKYGNSNYNNREKSKKTCLDKYGVDNPFKDITKMKESYLDKLGVDHPMHKEEIKQKVISKLNYDSIISKSRQTYKEKTGYDNPSKNPTCIQKMLNTKIINGCYDSPGTSNLERRLEKILQRKFPVVISKYRDDRYQRKSGYQYECDFYIPNEDLFIELNAHPTHYICPFNPNNPLHLQESLKLQTSENKWEKAVYETWVKRDVEKIQCAKENNLNYIVLYPSNSISNNKQFNNSKYSNLIEYLIKKLNKE